MTSAPRGLTPAVSAQEARFEARRKQVGLVLGPVVFALVLLFPFADLTPTAHRLAAVIALVIIFWVTEALPLAVTALLGPTLAVVLQVAPVGVALAPMANPIVFLFIGSFILAQALFVHRVNERIAYSVLSWKIIGARPTRILIAYGALAAFLSAWMSNTATAAMLVPPIGLSLIAFMESESDVPRSYGTTMMLMTAYGCSRGGMATPVGTPPNLITIAMLDDILGVRISFVEWMLLAVPVSLVLMGIVFVYLNWVGHTGVKEIPGADVIISERKRALGPWKPGERNAVNRLWRNGVSVGGPGCARADPRSRPRHRADGVRERSRVGRGADGRRPFVLPSDQRRTAVDDHVASGGPDRLGNHPVVRRRSLFGCALRVDRSGARRG